MSEACAKCAAPIAPGSKKHTLYVVGRPTATYCLACWQVVARTVFETFKTATAADRI